MKTIQLLIFLAFIGAVVFALISTFKSPAYNHIPKDLEPEQSHVVSHEHPPVQQTSADVHTEEITETEEIRSESTQANISIPVSPQPLVLDEPASNGEISFSKDLSDITSSEIKKLVRNQTSDN